MKKAAVKSLPIFLCVTIWLIPQTLKKTLVDLVVSCGGDTLTHFMANTEKKKKKKKKILYTSRRAVAEFVEALGTWTYKQYLVKQPKENMKLQFKSLLLMTC